MTYYYNEHDPFAAQWLRELMADGLIAQGEVDERSILEVTPSDLAGFRQCHFFAGIGIWSLALRLAGWPDDREVWTGSCPCQPFSAAGKGGGFADERHLWPAFHWLINQCRPTVVMGEQVSSDDGLAWIDLVLADLDQSGYACGALDTCAAGVGSPHIRQRLYWMGHANGRERGQGIAAPEYAEAATAVASIASGMADTERRAAERQRFDMGEAARDAEGQARQRKWIRGDGRHGGNALRPGPLNGLWRDADWLGCRDGKWRPVSPGTFPLVATGTVRNRVGQLRGAGNALNLAQAQAFIEAVMGWTICAEN